MFGFYFHEMCFILIEETEMVGGGGGLFCPRPPRMRTPPLLLHQVYESRREEGKQGPLPPFPHCLRLAHQHKRNAVDLPTGRAPLVRRPPLLRFSCSNRGPFIRDSENSKTAKEIRSNGPCDRDYDTTDRPLCACAFGWSRF